MGVRTRVRNNNVKIWWLNDLHTEIVEIKDSEQHRIYSGQIHGYNPNHKFDVHDPAECSVALSDSDASPIFMVLQSSFKSYVLQR